MTVELGKHFAAGQGCMDQSIQEWTNKICGRQPLKNLE